MKTFLIKFSSFTAVMAFAAALACAAVQGSKPPLHYAFLHKGQEQLTINWEGYVNWDTHTRPEELWVRKDGKTFLILDKATLAAMDQATRPLHSYPNTGDSQSDQRARVVQRKAVYAATDKIVLDAMAKGLGQPAKFQ